MLIIDNANDARGLEKHYQSLLKLNNGCSATCRYYLAKMGIQLLQPFPEAEFIQRSMPDELWPLPGSQSYIHCNIWLLYSALTYGFGKVRFICLWNDVDDWLGGTAHIYWEFNSAQLPFALSLSKGSLQEFCKCPTLLRN